MKRMIFIIALLLMSSIAMGQQATKVPTDSTKVVRIDSKTFGASKTSHSKEAYKPTGYYYQVKSGEKYEIHTHTITRGDNAGTVACYIKRVSKKTGKEYWQKIDVKPEELSK